MKKISSSQLQKALNEVNAFFSRGELEAAEKILNELVVFFPSHPDILSKLGSIYLYKGILDKGILCTKKSLEINPFQPKVLNDYAVALLNSNKLEDALNAVNKAISLNPNYTEAYYHQGIIYKQLNEFDSAIVSYKRVIELDHLHVLARVNAAIIFIYLEKFIEALNLLSEALSIDGNNAGIYYNLGLTYIGLCDFEKANTFLDSAISINSDFAEFYNAKGLTLKNLFQYERALEYFDKAITLNPNLFEALNNKGLLFEELLMFEEALEAYDKAADNNIGYDLPLYNKALLSLYLIRFEKGWQLYEKRDQIKHYLSSKNTSSKPYLEDISIGGKNLLIISEQGLGDQILFSSILRDLININYKLTVRCDSRLIDLFKRSFPEVDFTSTNDDSNCTPYDYEILMGSLPKFFRKKVSDFNLPFYPFIIPDKIKTENFKHKLKNSKKIICGISWLSKNDKVGNCKSLRLNQLLPILKIQNLLFVDLQYGDNQIEKTDLLKENNIELIKFDDVDSFNDIDSLTSIIDACDIIVTSSNVTAHIAGSIGKKTYLLAPRSRGRIWYWHNNLKQSIWYPSVEIFAQNEINNWHSPVNEVKEKIIKEIL